MLFGARFIDGRQKIFPLFRVHTTKHFYRIRETPSQPLGWRSHWLLTFSTLFRFFARPSRKSTARYIARKAGVRYLFLIVFRKQTRCLPAKRGSIRSTPGSLIASSPRNRRSGGNRYSFVAELRRCVYPGRALPSLRLPASRNRRRCRSAAANRSPPPRCRCRGGIFEGGSWCSAKLSGIPWLSRRGWLCRIDIPHGACYK